MKNAIKLIIDIVMGAVIPIIILERFSGPDRLGAVAAYVLAAFVPLAWVVIDLFFVTKKFNFITSYVGFSSIVSGVLAFWFVDGLLYAIERHGWIAAARAVFGGSVLLPGRILKYFFIQASTLIRRKNQSFSAALQRAQRRKVV